MGRETVCLCRWGDEVGECTVLLEGRELILRGGLRKKIALEGIRGVVVEGDAGDVAVVLNVGRETATRWAEAMAKPPTTLAKKLGITATSRVGLIGEVDDAEEELQRALAEAAEVTRSLAGGVDLVVAYVEEPLALANAVQRASGAAAIWVVYPKGAGTPLGEGRVREFLRGKGYMDTKVAAVSARLTGLRFTRRTG